ncbi:MAG TPA: DUF5615 family PIN-like protein [Parafilimonas sp.]|nr:DUF5615 family PIN-like protein [Parafilimonas sp.]
MKTLPDNFPLWNTPSFYHVLKVDGIYSDSDIWQYALINDLVIVTNDTDFYFRFLSDQRCPKIVWLRVGNLRKKELRFFVENFWHQIEVLLQTHSFVIADNLSLEAF